MTTSMINWTEGIKAAIHRMCTYLELHQASIIRNWHQRTRADRRICRINATVEYQGHRADVTIRNISRSGAGLQTDHPLQPGGSILISFPLDYLEPPVEVQAIVRWADNGAAGLEFKSA